MSDAATPPPDAAAAGRAGIVARLLGGPLRRSAARLTAAAMVGHAVLLIATPILTRLYAPSDFGAFAVYAVALAFLGVVVTLRLDVALTLPRTDARAAAVLTAGLLAALTISGAVALLSLLCGERLLSAVGATTMEPYLWIVPVGALCTGVWQLFLAWNVRVTRFSAIGTSKIAQNTSMSLAQVLLPALGALGLAVGDVLGRIVSTAVLAQPLLHRGRSSRVPGGLRRAMGALREYRRFPLLATPAAILNTAGAMAPLVLVLAVFGEARAGLFLLAMRVAQVPMVFLGRSIGQVYVGTAARLAREQPEALRALHAAVSRKLLLVGLVPTLMAATLSEAVFGVVLGETWAEAGTYVQILSATLLAQFVVSPASQTLLILQHHRTQFLWDLARLGLSVAPFLLAKALHWPLVSTIGVYGVSAAAAYAFLWLLTRRAVTRIHARHAGEPSPHVLLMSTLRNAQTR